MHGTELTESNMESDFRLISPEKNLVCVRWKLE